MAFFGYGEYTPITINSGVSSFMVRNKMEDVVIVGTTEGGDELALMLKPSGKHISQLPPAARFLLSCYARANADQAFFEEMMDWGPKNSVAFLEGLTDGPNIELVQ